MFATADPALPSPATPLAATVLFWSSGGKAVENMGVRAVRRIHSPRGISGQWRQNRRPRIS